MLALCASNSASWRIASACRMTAADAVEEVWLNPAAKEIQDIGQSIRAGDVIVKVSNIASEDELKALLDAGILRQAQKAAQPMAIIGFQ